MTDKELLELAAKAAEIKIRWSADSLGNQTGPWIFNSRWNPLTDDGDALRLAVKLNMLEEGIAPFVELMWRLSTETGPDDYAATRRAITRAAAEIGKAAP